ncbi:zinc finger CCHC domain-containing protein 8 [Lepisosteus oculatus]|uniref:zinc finger CCHC domain-containing protein 8 n=1 Tax=Lepisosteus oculatus TaxID=7918 RepID=UPI0003EA97C0|nr:PREDICTED: zinc finger CCHC domain-containing protein 8 [Lepisosteus oculatus]
MSEVDFGDTELFQQLGENKPVAMHIRFKDDEESPDELQELRERLEECEQTITRLKAENQELKRKLKILTQPSGITVDDSKVDGPLLQILFTNNVISKQFHQDIEDCIFSLIQKHEEQLTSDKESPSFNVRPQPSSFVLEEHHKVNTSSTIKKIKDAFSVVGNVLYFTSFCLDKLGQPLLNENPQLTDGWEIPKYQQVFGTVISLDGQEVQIKEKRPKPCCFNCGSDAHQLKDCPKPRDVARISEKRKEFSQSSSQSNQRYHVEEVEERFGKYKPGRVSEELQDALGIEENTLPPFVYRMRQLGYPPGWLKEAEMENSGLTLYDGKAGSDGEIEEDENSRNQQISYDVSKLIDFPGFNVSAPKHIMDEWRQYGSIPMQSNHLKENFAAYLSSNFPMPTSDSKKRVHDWDSSPRNPKKRKSDISDSVRSLDMEVDSGSETPRSSRSYNDFPFQPPLPPGSPALGTPPPQPWGSPPGTPPNFIPPPPPTPTPPPLPKGTPPLTPSNGSPAVRVRGGEDSTDEDGLTLEELEEQQRLIWAALENTEANTNSDSEISAGTPIATTSAASSPCLTDAEAVAQEGVERLESSDASPGNADCANKAAPAAVSSDVGGDDDDDDDADVIEVEKEALCEVGPGGPGLAASSAVVKQETNVPEHPGRETEESGDASEKVESVPHRSKFAEGIIPFEDTAEYTNVAEATGVYLRIRDLLKGSPRNQSRNKK